MVLTDFEAMMIVGFATFTIVFVIVVFLILNRMIKSALEVIARGLNL